MEDFRKADPTYINFVPKTAAEAIDLFWRMRKLGLKSENFPEAFCWASRELDGVEGAKFEDWLVAPQGVSFSAEVIKKVDPNQEAIRLQLLKEAEERDLKDRMERLKIDEDDEKSPISSLEPEQQRMHSPDELVFKMDDDETDAPPDDDDVPMVSPSDR